MTLMKDVSLARVHYTHGSDGGTGGRIRGSVTYNSAISTHVPEWDLDHSGTVDFTSTTVDQPASSYPGGTGSFQVVVWDPATVDMSDSGLLTFDPSQAVEITSIDVSENAITALSATPLSGLVYLTFDGHDESEIDINATVAALVTNANSSGTISFSKSASHSHFFDGMTTAQLQAIADLTGRFIANGDLYTPATNGATGLGWTINGGYADGQRLFNGTGFTADGKYAIDSLHTGTARDLQPGRARTFDGVDDFIAIPAATLGDIANPTVTCWVKIAAAGSKRIFGRRQNATDGFSLFHGSNIQLVLADGVVPNSLVLSGPAVTIGEWMHVAFTYDGTTVRLYIDGIEYTSSAFAGLIAYIPGLDWTIASSSSSFDGQIFDVRIFDRALTDAEVRDTMTPTAVTNGLVAWYKLDEPNARSSTSNAFVPFTWDSSGNGYHAHPHLGGVNTDTAARPEQYVSATVPYSFSNAVGYSDTGSPLGAELVTSNNTNWSAALAEDAPFVTSDAMGVRVESSNSFFVNARFPGVTIEAGKVYTFEFDVLENTTTGSYFRPLTNNHYDNLRGILSPRQINLETPTAADGLDSFVYRDGYLEPGRTGHVKFVARANPTDLTLEAYMSPLAPAGEYVKVGNYSVREGGDYTVPRDEGTPTLSLEGETLDYSGEAPRNAKLVDSHCLTLDGLDDQVQSADTGSSIPVKKLSIRFKGDLTYTSVTAFDPLITFYDASVDSLGILVGSSTSLAGIVDEVINFKTSNTAHSALEAITLSNDWHLLEANWDGSKYTMKLDGVELSVNHQGTAVQWDARQVTLGARGGFGSLFPGRLADVQIYDNSDVLQYHYKCSEGSGTVLYDYSGNGRHITMVNTSDGVNWPNLQDEYHANIIDGFSDVGGVKVGRLTNGSTDAQGNTVTNPTGNWHNGAETQLDLTGGVAVPFASTMGNMTFAYSDDPANVSCHFETNANGQVFDLYSETNHLIYRG